MSSAFQLSVSGSSPRTASAPNRPEPCLAPELDETQLLQLLQRVCERDQAAFTTLHRAMARRVFAFAMRIVRDEGHAEEVVVDTMLEVWQHPQRFRGGSRLSTWILGIARHKALTVLRRLRPADVGDDGDLERMASDEAGGFDVVASLQRRDGVRKCMCELTSAHRECMHLVFYEGLSLAEVAGIQACPENTVKTRLFHARKKIERCLRRLLDPGHGSAAAEPAL